MECRRHHRCCSSVSYADVEAVAAKIETGTCVRRAAFVRRRSAESCQSEAGVTGVRVRGNRLCEIILRKQVSCCGANLFRVFFSE